MTKHSPTPWRINHKYNITNESQRGIASCGGSQSNTEDSHTENIANAAHIVKCVNSHDALIDLLTGMIDIAKIDGWDKAITGRQILYREAKALLEELEQ